MTTDVDIKSITTNPLNTRACITVSAKDGIYRVVNGHMRLSAALDIQGFAIVTDVQTGRELRITRNSDGLLVESK